MNTKTLAAVLLCTSTMYAQSNISPVNKYAWGENIGWINWHGSQDSSSGAIVTENFIAGMIWSENVGWINLGDCAPAGGIHFANTDASDFGVNIDASGDLFGYAWAENAGWVNFDTAGLGPDRARIDLDSKRLQGFVWSENLGWLSLGDGVNFVELLEPPAPTIPMSDGRMGRYLAFNLDAVGMQLAIRLTMTDLSVPPGRDWSDSVGQTRWLGAPAAYPDENSSDPTASFVASRLECEPHYRNWATSDTLYVFGGEIVPSSTYTVEAFIESCAGPVLVDFKSQPVIAQTGKFGDVVLPYFGAEPSVPQPDFSDIAAVVSKFLAVPDAPRKAHAQLQPNVPMPDRPIDFRDIAAAVEGFLGEPYPYVGPCTCPSVVPCGDTACTVDANCVDGLCIDGHCTDPCGRCALISRKLVGHTR